MTKSKRIFISFSRSDQDAVEKLTQALKPLVQNKPVELWTANAMIASPGRIPSQLESADLILLLSSTEFLANGDCQEQVQAALNRQRGGAAAVGAALVLPIIVSACLWQKAPFGHLQPLPKGGVPVNQWPVKEEAWLDITLGVYKALEMLDESRETPEQAPMSTRSSQGRRETILQNLAVMTKMNFGMSQVTKILHEREPSATFSPEDVPKPLGSLLRVTVGDDNAVKTRLIGSVSEVTEDVLQQFVEKLAQERAEDRLLAGMLVYHDTPPRSALLNEADAQDIDILSFGEFKERADFRAYLADLTRQRESDLVYSRALYVDPFAVLSSPALPEGEETESAVQWITTRMLDPDPQLIVVRSEIGGGKTFLLRELARRMASPSSPRIPVLVKTEALENAETLHKLVAENLKGMSGSVSAQSFVERLRDRRIMMLFDDIDEVTSGATQKRVDQIADLLAEAFGRGARLVLTYRSTEQRLRKAIEERFAKNKTYCAVDLRPFSVAQIRSSLVRKLRSETAGEQRLERIGKVPDLLALSHNPRMLSIVSEIDEEDLVSAASHEGGATPSSIYRHCIERWIAMECGSTRSAVAPRDQNPRRQMQFVTGLAAYLWQRRARSFYARDLPPELRFPARMLGLEDAVKEVPPTTTRNLVGRTLYRTPLRGLADLAVNQIRGLVVFSPFVKVWDEQKTDRAAGRLNGAGTLFTQDARQAWSFSQDSIFEWFVISKAAEELQGTGQSATLEAAELTELGARFLVDEAGRSLSGAWAAQALLRAHEPTLSSARRVEALLGIQAGAEDTDFSSNKGPPAGQQADETIGGPPSALGGDLRRKDLSGATLSGRDLRFFDLRDARLVGANLSDALLMGARLNGADLSGACLAGADLSGANLSFARLLAADLSGAKASSDTKLQGAKLVSAKVDASFLRQAQTLGATTTTDLAPEPMFGANPSACHCVAFSPDGRLLATGHHDGTLRLYAARGGGPVRILWRRSSPVRAVAFSGRSGILATASADQVVTLWDTTRGSILHELRQHTGAVVAVAFNADGTLLATASEDRSIVVWNVLAGVPKHAIKGDASTVNLVFGANGDTIFAGLSDGSVARWPLGGQLRVDAVAGSSALIASVAFHLESGYFASGSAEGAVRIWRHVDPGSARSLAMGTRAVLSIAFSPAGDLLAAGTAGGAISIWNLHTDCLERTIDGHTDSVRAIAFSPDGKTLATGSADQTATMWDVATGERKRAVAEKQKGVLVPVTAVAFHPTADLLATGSGEHTITWRVGSGEVTHVALGHLAHVSGIAFSPDGSSLASASDDRTVLLWQGSGGAARRVLKGHTAPVRGVAFSPTEPYLATASNDDTARVWRLPDGECQRILKGHTDYVRAVAWSPQGRILATASDDRTVRTWNAATGDALAVMSRHTAYVLSVAYHPLGDVLASGSRDESVLLWDVKSGKCKGTLRGHSGPVRGLAFSPDGSALASCSDDQTIRLWTTATGALIRTLRGHRGYVSAVAFHPKGRILASASGDGTVRLWETSTGQLLATLLKLPDGWVAFAPDGRYRLGGSISGAFWHASGFCRFEPGELDPYLPSSMRVVDESHLFLGP